MSFALEITREDTPASADGPTWSDLWLLPLLLLVQVFARFSRHLDSLKNMRRTRPMPRDWRSFYPDLRRTEWAIRMLCHEGARRIILGEDFDLSAITFDPEPPEDFQPPTPRSALAMHQRIEATARFHADPERFIRRHAERVRGRTGDVQTLNLAPSNFPDPDPPDCGIPDTPFTAPVPIAIRGPP
jgi:hypothetical protein